MMDGYWFGSGGLPMLLFWVFVIAGTVWLVLALSRSPFPRGFSAERDPPSTRRGRQPHAGRYDAYCSMPGHADLGMRASVILE